MVLEYAVELKQDSQIVVYNVINQRNYSVAETVSMWGPVYPAQILDTDEIQRQIKERQGTIKGWIKEHFFPIKSRMSFKIDVGNPSEQILKIIETEDIDLVVMANKGRGNLSTFLFGSAAEKVFRHSPVPVISIRDPKKFKREK